MAMFRRRGGLERGVGGREGGWGLCDWGSCSSPRSRGVGRAACAAGLLNVLVLSALGGRAHSPLMEGGVSAAFGSGVARMYDGVPWGGAGKGMRALVSPGGMLRLRGGVGKLAKRGKGEGEVGRKQAIGEGMKGKIERKEKSKSKLRPGKDSLSEARRKRKVSKREERRREERTSKAKSRKAAAAAAAAADGASVAVSRRQGSEREEGEDSDIRMSDQDARGVEQQHHQVEEEEEEEEGEEEEYLPVLSMGAPEGQTMAPLNSTLPSEAILRPFWDTSGKGRDLASTSEVQRKMAEGRLIAAINHTFPVPGVPRAGGTHKDLSYAVQRLVRGLSSSRHQAGVGFCDCLTTLIANAAGNEEEGGVPLHRVLALVDQHLDYTPSNLERKEVTALSTGHFNAVLAIARGTPPSHRTGPLLADLCTRLLRIIVRIGAKKPLSLAAADLLTDLASEMAGGITLSDGNDAGEAEGGVEGGGVRGVRMPELDDLLAPRVAAALGTTDRGLHPTELMLLLRLQNGPIPPLCRHVKGWAKGAEVLLSVPGHATRVMETLRNSTAPGDSSTLHPVWADVIQAASSSGGTSSEATLRLIWDHCLSRFPVQLQIQAMSLAAPCAPPSTLAAWMSHRDKSSSVDEPPALAMGLAMSLSRGQGGAEAAAALEARARSGGMTPEAASVILESLTDASPNFDSVTGTRLSAALIEVGEGGRGGGRHVRVLAERLGRAIAVSESYDRYMDGLFAAAQALGNEGGGRQVALLLTRMALFKGGGRDGLWEAVMPMRLPNGLPEVVRRKALVKVFSLVGGGGGSRQIKSHGVADAVGREGFLDAVNGAVDEWLRDAAYQTCVPLTAHAKEQASRLRTLCIRVRAKQAEKDAGNGRDADADKDGGVAGSKLHASVQSRETVTEAMLVQLRMFVLFDATSKGVAEAVDGVCRSIESWLDGNIDTNNQSDSSSLAVCGGVVSLLERESAALRELGMRVFKSSVAQMGDECVEMIMRSICGKRPSGEEEEEEGEDDEFGSSGFEALREGGLGGSDVDVSMDGGEEEGEEGEEEEGDRDMKDDDGEDDEEALQGRKADFATRGEVGGEENDAGVEEGGMAGGSSDGGTWQQPDHNIALSQADSEELREMDERMRAAHSIKSSAAHDATQSLHLRAKSVDLLEAWVKAHPSSTMSFNVTRQVMGLIADCLAERRPALASLHDRLTAFIVKTMCSSGVNPPPKGDANSEEAAKIVAYLVRLSQGQSAMFGDTCITAICWALKSVPVTGRDTFETALGKECLVLMREAMTNATSTRKGGFGLRLFRSLCTKVPQWTTALLPHLVNCCKQARSAYLREECLAAIALATSTCPEERRGACLSVLVDSGVPLTEAIAIAAEEGGAGGGGESKKGKKKKRKGKGKRRGVLAKSVGTMCKMLGRAGVGSELAKKMQAAISSGS